MKTHLPLSLVGVAAFVVAVLLSSSMFVVNQGEMALVLRFGAVSDPENPVKTPGLHVKLPLVEDVVRFDARLLDVDPPAEQMILADQKRIVVDSYTRFRIRDPLQFYQAVRTQEVAGARLREIVNNSARRVLGGVTLPTVLSPEREQIMREIQRQANEAARPLGVDVVDVRIRRADLPPETSQAIFKRMESERQREAADARAQGQQRAFEIRAGADRERVVIAAEAQRQAQILRGQGESEAAKIYADAFQADPQFYAFYRSLQAYRQALGDSGTTFVLTPDSEFFRYFNRAAGGK
ncbi:MAG TPA: protease modulator HflC [Candidatus Sulfotelmatobacter sp.]|jgi:membrane protease subunit HflC|nr:protease modulator HflC [Candidatus Sulfotelmatobacter sp.]